MNFSDPYFLFIFLPCCILIFYAIKLLSVKTQIVILTLTLASLIFYSISSLFYFGIFAFSLVSNFLLAKVTIHLVSKKNKQARVTFISALLINIIPLIYFKFLLLDINPLTISRNLDGAESIVLPLGISFYTFQQIALQIDCFWGRLRKLTFLEYSAFISFFPQLIAGPIVYHREIIPQFTNLAKKPIRPELLAAGVLIFSIGLFKKAVIAENLAIIVDKTYYSLEIGNTVSIVETWTAFFAFPLQVYFDFSAYSDMACGIALFFGIALTQNFNSPFKSSNIIDFWNRWHITLMRFFRDYIYNPISVRLTRYTLTNNVSGASSFFFCSFIPVMSVFFLTGIWHGSSINFVLYGLVHGLAVCVNYGWRQYIDIRLPQLLCWLLTFLFVCFAFVLMRANDFSQFTYFLNLMLGIHSSQETTFSALINLTFSGLTSLPLASEDIILVLLWLIVCVYFPNSNSLVPQATLDGMANDNHTKVTPQMAFVKVALAGCIAGVAYLNLSSAATNFIYFQF